MRVCAIFYCNSCFYSIKIRRGFAPASRSRRRFAPPALDGADSAPAPVGGGCAHPPRRSLPRGRNARRAQQQAFSVCGASVAPVWRLPAARDPSRRPPSLRAPPARLRCFAAPPAPGSQLRLHARPSRCAVRRCRSPAFRSAALWGAGFPRSLLGGGAFAPSLRSVAPGARPRPPAVRCRQPQATPVPGAWGTGAAAVGVLLCRFGTPSVAASKGRFPPPVRSGFPQLPQRRQPPPMAGKKR